MGVIFMINKVSSFKFSLFIVSLVFILLGLYSVVYPNGIVMFLSYVIGTILCAVGVSYVFEGIRNSSNMMFPFFKIFFGIIFCILGVTFIIKHNIPYVIIAFGFGVWAISVGSYKLWLGLEFRKQGQKCTWLIVGSILHILFGIAMFVFPMITTSIWIQVFGLYWIFLGICIIISLFSKDSYINLLPF